MNQPREVWTKAFAVKRNPRISSLDLQKCGLSRTRIFWYVGNIFYDSSSAKFQDTQFDTNSTRHDQSSDLISSNIMDIPIQYNDSPDTFT